MALHWPWQTLQRGEPTAVAVLSASVDQSRFQAPRSEWQPMPAALSRPEPATKPAPQLARFRFTVQSVKFRFGRFSVPTRLSATVPLMCVWVGDCAGQPVFQWHDWQPPCPLRPTGSVLSCFVTPAEVTACSPERGLLSSAPPGVWHTSQDTVEPAYQLFAAGVAFPLWQATF